MLIDERKRRRIEALVTDTALTEDLSAFLSEPIAPLPWGQEATPGQELVEVARSASIQAREALASRLTDLVTAHACSGDSGHLRVAEEAAYAVGLLEVDIDTDVLRRAGTTATHPGVSSHALRSAYAIEGRRGSLDAPDPFWVALLSSPHRKSRACAAHAVLSRSTPGGRDHALRLGLAADIDSTSLATLAHRWATTPPVHAPDLPDDLRALLATGLADSGHDPAAAGRAAKARE